MIIEMETDREAYDYARENGLKIQDIQYTSDGLVMAEVAKDLNNEIAREAKKKKKDEAVVYTVISNASKMYLAEAGTTFDCKQAKRFNAIAAKDKAGFMSRNSNSYVWNFEKTS